MLRNWLTTLAIVTLALRNACADIDIVDQQNLNNEGLMADSTRFSQSFTPSLTSLNAIDVILAAPGSTAPTRLQLLLFQGSGLGGPVLRASDFYTLPAGSGPTLMEFTFATPVILQPGTLHTFTIGSPNLTAFSARYGLNTYAGGNMFDSGHIYPDRDLYFREGLSVPEPMVSMLILMSFAAAVFLAQKHRASHV